MRIDKTTSLLLFLDVFKDENNALEDLFAKLENYPLPQKYSKSFNDLTFGQLIQLQTNIKTFDNLLFDVFKIVYDLPRAGVLAMSAFDALRCSLHAKNELERITALFEKIRYKPSAEEQRAGIDDLNHGFFGTMDYYAKRMGITDHKIVEDTKWIFIYKCLEIDFKDSQFAKKYRQVVESKRK